MNYPSYKTQGIPLCCCNVVLSKMVLHLSSAMLPYWPKRNSCDAYCDINRLTKPGGFRFRVKKSHYYVYGIRKGQVPCMIMKLKTETFASLTLLLSPCFDPPDAHHDHRDDDFWVDGFGDELVPIIGVCNRPEGQESKYPQHLILPPGRPMSLPHSKRPRLLRSLIWGPFLGFSRVSLSQDSNECWGHACQKTIWKTNNGNVAVAFLLVKM